VAAEPAGQGLLAVGAFQRVEVDPLGLELAADLVDLVDSRSGGDLLDRVKALRRKVAGELGIVIPPVRTRDSLELPPHTYAIKLYGVEVARGEAPRGTMLAIGDVISSLPGRSTREPVFGLEAKWIPAEMRHQAETAGATVVDRASVVTTHLADVVHQHAAHLLGREDVRLLTDVVKRTHPAVVEELTPAQLSLGEVQRVLRALLEERVPIRDLVRILEALSVRASVSKDLDGLVEAARSALEPALAAPYLVDGTLHAISFDPLLEQRMLEGLRQTEHGATLVIDPETAQHVLITLGQLVTTAENQGLQPVLVCAPQLRAAVRRFVRPAVERLPVLAYTELNAARTVSSAGVVDAAPAGALAVGV
jgi:flagellar biosynthesis protein FlhA